VQFGLDPKNQVYYNRTAVRAAKRARKTRLMKEIFGYDLVRSDFLAFDPFDNFLITPYYITSKNRKRTVVASSGYPRKKVRHKNYVVYDTPLYVASPGVNRRRPYGVVSSSSSVDSIPMADQPRILGFIDDTTKATRGSASDFGEAEMFLPRITVHNTSTRYSPSTTWLAGEDLFGPYKKDDIQRFTATGISARITQAAVDTYLTLERAKFTQDARTLGENLVAQALPSSRKFGFLREFIELKDLPQTILGSITAVKDGLRGVFDPSSAYLNKEFGWDTIVDSTLKMVSLPDKITKEVNYLLARAGKPSTFRATKRLAPEYIGSAGAFTFDPLFDESLKTPSTAGFRTAEYRLALNYTVKFPKLELPMLKEYLTNQLWGARFRVDDFYNLVPWSWLVDWFTGLGDYLEAFAAINQDTSIANYGFLTYVSQGWVAGVCEGEFSETRSGRFNGGPIETTSNKKTASHSALLRYKYLNRVDVTSLSLIKSSWLPENFSGFQASILLALAGRRS
jgi:hypothetical protein